MPIHNHRGVTLIELMIAMSLVSLITLFLGTFLVNGIRYYKLTSAKSDIQRDVRSSIDLINRNLRQAKASTVVISAFDAAQPPCSFIEFTHINNDAYRFYQKNSDFYFSIKRAGATAWENHRQASNMRMISFAYPRTDDSSIVSVSLCFEKATYEGKSKALQLSVEKIRVMNQ